MRPPPELLTAASLAAPPTDAAALGGLPAWSATVGYEHLLRVQQRQHDLAMQHKEAEVAHIRARAELAGAGLPPDAAHLAAVLQTQEEEASLMMAARHKELELMAGLLHLREQQIEEFRQLCEAQRLEIQRLQRARGAEGPAEGGGLGPRAVAPRGEPGGGAPAASDGAAGGGPTAEEYAVLQREVARLRSRMAELEAAVDEQHERGAGLARALEGKSARVRVLEEQVRSLRLPAGAWTDEDQESALGGAPGSAEAPPLAAPAGASGEPSPPRLLLPPSQHGHQLFGPSQWDGRPASHGRARPCDAASDEGGDVLGVPPEPPASGSSAQAGAGGTAGGPGAPWTGASEAAETGRQSQELLREMRRLRQQMGDLERLARTAGARDAGRRAGPRVAAVGRPRGGSVAGQDRLLASGSSFGGCSSAEITGGLGGADCAGAADAGLGRWPASQNAFLERARHAAGLTA